MSNIFRLLVTLLVLTGSGSSQPNPYRTVENWFKLPEGRTWGSTSSVEVDRDGKSIWVAERCGANTCAGSSWRRSSKFDASGQAGEELRRGPVRSSRTASSSTRDGNVWVTDGAGRRTARATRCSSSARTARC